MTPGPAPRAPFEANAPTTTGSIGLVAYNPDGRSRVREERLVQERPYVAENRPQPVPPEVRGHLVEPPDRLGQSASGLSSAGTGTQQASVLS